MIPKVSGDNSIMTVAANKGNSAFASMPDEKGLKRSTTFKDRVAEIQDLVDNKSYTLFPTEDQEVDVTQIADSSIARQSPSDDPDATEYSSSFGDTASRSEDTAGLSDAEVESEFCVNSSLPSILDNNDSIFGTRKKKLTSHWRNFIRPLMWRCKWAELKMKELEAQSEKYTRDLVADDQTTLFEPHQYASEFCSKSLPFVSHSAKRKSMKRRKRKQVEGKTDIASFMSHHHLFSYLENKKSGLDISVDDAVVADPFSKHDEFAIDDQWFRDDQKAMEHILSKIETVQSQVHSLRTLLNTVILKNGVHFSSSENLSLLAPYDAQTSSGYSPAISAGNGDTFSNGAIYTSQDFPNFEIEDLVLDDAMVTSYGIPTDIPDIIESTSGLLSAADVTVHQPNLVEYGENTLDNAFVQNQEGQDDHLFSGILDGTFDMDLDLENDEQSHAFVPISELIPSSIDEKQPILEKSAMDSCFPLDVKFPKAKRKRGDRKAGPCGWNTKTSGEADSL